MKTKTIENFIYEGLGFPIQLKRVQIIYIDGEWHPKIDVHKVSREAIKALVTQNSRLSGNQVKFIRLYFCMTLREFAKQVVHESHTAVSKWEKYGDEATNMDGNIEAMLRLYVYEKQCMKTEKQRNSFYKKYQEVKQLFLTDKYAALITPLQPSSHPAE